MLKNIYVVFDKRACLYSNPIFQPEGFIKRCLIGMLMDPDCIYSISPSDYDVHQIGTFDPESGVLDITSTVYLFSLDELSQQVESNFRAVLERLASKIEGFDSKSEEAIFKS